METLLTALAYGAGTVAVTCGEQNPTAIRTAVEQQAQMAVAVLKGLNIPSDRIRFAAHPAEDKDSQKWAFPVTGPGARSADSGLPPAQFSFRNDKRTLVRLATQHLYERSGAQQPSLPLPPGSPFGTVAIDAARCTLCMACVAACPFGALSAGVELPRLEFRESACRQCGLCEETCPERALRLLPRILCDPRAVETPAVIREAEPFRCIDCGVPFASPAIITRMEEKLAGHWMYRDERQLRRLRLCAACRARDTLASQDVKSWSW
jgi:ferredoxin